MLESFLSNVSHNLFKPLLLFFYAGFLIPVLRVKFEFPKVLYQSLTIFLLLAIGWHGGEELANLDSGMLAQAGGFMVVGFITNTIIGIVAFATLRGFTRLRRIDAATVAAYYGSDSAGTFVTCVGVLAAANIAYAPYMPVLLAIMEIPGCLVALYLIARMRNSGVMDALGNMPGEEGYSRFNRADGTKLPGAIDEELEAVVSVSEDEEELVGATSTRHGGTVSKEVRRGRGVHHGSGHGGSLPEEPTDNSREDDLVAEDEIALRKTDSNDSAPTTSKKPVFNAEMLHEVFLNPGIYLLFAGIAIGFISGRQGAAVIKKTDLLFINMFDGLLALFLLEMGMTASRKLKDLKAGGWQFIAFALIAPNVFATFGMLVAHGYAVMTGHPFELGTYVLFAVLCGASSYIAVPAVQRMAIPEASPTLPLAASLGLTFSYNVTVGIPVYMEIAKLLMGTSG